MGQWGKIKYEGGYSFIPHVKVDEAFGRIKATDVIDKVVMLNVHAEVEYEFSYIENKYTGMVYSEYLKSFGKGRSSMKITERQAIALFTIAYDSLKTNVLGVYSMGIRDRQALVNTIINQQDNLEPLDVILEGKGDGK